MMVNTRGLKYVAYCYSSMSLPSSLSEWVVLETIVPLNAQTVPPRMCGLEDGLEHPAEAELPGPGRKGNRGSRMRISPAAAPIRSLSGSDRRRCFAPAVVGAIWLLPGTSLRSDACPLLLHGIPVVTSWEVVFLIHSRGS